MLTQNISYSKDRPITVKFMSRNIVRGGSIDWWLRQFPGNVPEWGNCRFVFDIDSKEYDWLAVYHDLSHEPRKLSEEKLQCQREKTILVTTEPSTITVYGTDYLKQFGYILTSQEPWAITHPNRIFTQPGLIWFYGFPFSGGPIRTYDEMKVAAPPEKTKLISTVCSSRKGRLTIHSKRDSFTQRLKSFLPELDIYGHGVNPMSDKIEALDPYQYHIAIENHVYPHHITEKIPDTFLGFAVPFYHGGPNAADYFPPESFIPIDIGNVERTLDIIRSAIANNEYQDRLPYVIEARCRVLEKYNTFAILDREISNNNSKITQSNPEGVIMNRTTLRIKRPIAGIRSLVEKVIIKSKHRFGLQG